MNQFAYPRIDPNAYLGQVDFSPLLRVISGYRDAVDNAEDYRTRQRVGAALADNDFGAARQAGAAGGMDPGSLLALGQRQMEDERRRQQDETWQRMKGNASMFSGFGPMGSVVQQLPADLGLPALMDLYKSQAQNELLRAQTQHYRSKAQATQPAEDPNLKFLRAAQAAGIRPNSEPQDGDGSAIPTAPYPSDQRQEQAPPQIAPTPQRQEQAPPQIAPTPSGLDRAAATRGNRSWRDVLKGKGAEDGGASPDVSVSGQLIPDQAAVDPGRLPDPGSERRTSLRGQTRAQTDAALFPDRYNADLVSEQEKLMGITPQQKLTNMKIQYLSQGRNPPIGYEWRLDPQGNLFAKKIAEPGTRKGDVSPETVSLAIDKIDSAMKVLGGTLNRDGSPRGDGPWRVSKIASDLTGGYMFPDLYQALQTGHYAAMQALYAQSGKSFSKAEMENDLKLFKPLPTDTEEMSLFKLQSVKRLLLSLDAARSANLPPERLREVYKSAISRSVEAFDRRSGQTSNAAPSSPQVAPDRQRDRLKAKYGLE